MWGMRNLYKFVSILWQFNNNIYTTAHRADNQTIFPPQHFHKSISHPNKKYFYEGQVTKVTNYIKWAKNQQEYVGIIPLHFWPAHDDLMQLHTHSPSYFLARFRKYSEDCTLCQSGKHITWFTFSFIPLRYQVFRKTYEYLEIRYAQYLTYDVC